jgi:hypothetical protein
MSPKILRRCSICKNFHASFLVIDPQQGKLYLCKDCWKARFSPKPDDPDAVDKLSNQEKQNAS